MPGLDAYLQLGNQEACNRLVRYFNAHEGLHVFPPDFADSAQEIEARSFHSGPRLTVFKGLHITPEDFLRWLDTHPFLKRHVCRVYFVLGGSDQAHITSREELLQDIIQHGAPPTTLRVASSPKSLEPFLVEHLPPAFQLDPKNFSAVLMIVEAGGRLHWSIQPSHLFFCLSSNESKIFEGTVANAVNKISEAIEVLGLQQCRQKMRTALDVGAAPGSWTAYLAHNAENVIAVDPAELAPEVKCLPNVHHIQTMSNDLNIAAAISAALGSEDASVDVLTCDINAGVREMVKPILPLLRFLRPGGICICTMKMPGTGRDRSAVFQMLAESFSGMLEDMRYLMLLANTRSEATFVAKRKSG